MGYFHPAKSGCESGGFAFKTLRLLITIEDPRKANKPIPSQEGKQPDLLGALLEVADRDFASLNDGICCQATRSEVKLNPN